MKDGDVAVLGWFHDPACLVVTHRKAAEAGEKLFPWCTCKRAYQVGNGDCGYGVVPEEWHHGVAGPPMTDTPADRCER